MGQASHLTREQASNALRRGKQVEQLLGRHRLLDGRVLLRYVTAAPTASGYVARLHEVFEEDDVPVESLRAVDITEEFAEGKRILLAEDVDQLLNDLQDFGTSMNRWVHFTYIGDQVALERNATTVEERLGDSFLDFLEGVSSRSAPAPWEAWVEGRDGTSASSVILVQPGSHEQNDIYLTRDMPGTSDNEVDVVALSRSYLMPLIEEVRRLRSEPQGEKPRLAGVPTLIAGSVTLRPFAPRDAAFVATACSNAPDICRYTFMPDDMTHEIAERWVARSIDSWKQDTPRFAITESPTDTALGQVGIAFSWDERRAEVFYWLAQEARGRGLASRAVNLVAEWAFGEFDIRRLQLVTEQGNYPSESVASRCGFVNEGLIRAWQEVKGKQPDVHMWSRVRNGDPPNST